MVTLLNHSSCLAQHAWSVAAVLLYNNDHACPRCVLCAPLQVQEQQQQLASLAAELQASNDLAAQQQKELDKAKRSASCA
jgi:hypothetical protein